MGLESFAIHPNGNRFKSVAAAIETLMPDEPAICFSPRRLKETAALFLSQFPGEVCYAVKANPSPRLLKTLWEAGIRVFDVASPAEIDAVKKRFVGAGCHYHNPVKSRHEIRTAYAAYGVRRFAVDNAAELEKIAATIRLTRDVEIAVRFKRPRHNAAVHDFSTKFGATPAEAVALVRRVDELGAKPVLAFHPGSQLIDGAVYADHIATAREIITQSGCDVATLNVGGGFPSRYTGSTADPADMIAAVRNAVTIHFGAIDAIKLECEPGRGLVAPCMTLVARVKLVKTETNEIYLNEGIYGSLLEVNQASALLPEYRLLGFGHNRTAPPVDFTAFGPTCDPYDRLPVPLRLPADITDGDYIAFDGIGAYSVATTTPFNGYGAVHFIEVEDF